MAIDKNKFSKVTQLVIDNLEGGYYNPIWHSVGDFRYSSSGETMFGIDRKAGGSINDTIAGKKFWGIIDKNKNPQVWKWNYKGGGLNQELKDLTVDIMYPVYERNAENYLSTKAREIVEKDNKLLFHFIYASWNGAGWFKKFAKDINEAVDKGITDTNKLSQIAIDSRTKEGLKEGSSPNSLIAQGGNKIAKLFNSIKDFTEESKEVVKKNLIPIVIIGLGVILGSYYLIKKYK